MSPPIRDGSGNDIGSIRLGDGSEISEVRTGAGDVVFSGGSVPESVTNQWPMDEGSGTILTDNIGTKDLSINGATWKSGEGSGGFYLDYDGTNDQSINDDNTFWNTDTFSFAIWLNADDLSNDARAVSTSPDGAADGWSIQTNNSEFEFFLRDGSPTSHTVRTSGASTGTWTFIGVASDGSEMVLHSATENDNSLTTAGTEPVSAGFDRPPENIMFGNLDSFSLHYDGRQDNAFFAENTKIPKSDFGDIFSSTKGNFP